MRKEDIAEVCHAANRALQRVAGQAVNPDWSEAPEWMRESALVGVDNALAGATAQQMHEAWSRARRAAGWVWGHVKSDDEKTHPCLVEYDQLSEVDRAKDVLFLAIVGALVEVQV